MSLYAWRDGSWRAVALLGVAADGALQPVEVANTVSDGAVSAVFTVRSASEAFTPWVTPIAGASLAWYDAAGNLLSRSATPSLTGQTCYVLRAQPDAIRFINCGFNANDDAGRDNWGSANNWAATNLIGVSGINYFTSLEVFAAASTPLTGLVDLSGLSQLQYAEFCYADVTSTSLNGCTSLIRLCLEQNNLTQLDLNPVRANLRDLRAANQRNGAGLTFTPLTGAMEQLWHYCIRDQVVVNHFPHSRLPVVEQLWDWNTGQTTSDAPISPHLGSYLAYGNSFDQASVDRILISLRDHGPTAGSVDLSGSAAPSAAGVAAASTLTSRGWLVT